MSVPDIKKSVSVLHLGVGASFDELPLSIAVYTSYSVGEVVHTISTPGPNSLELTTYVTISIQSVSPPDAGGYFILDSSTSKHINSGLVLNVIVCTFMYYFFGKIHIPPPPTLFINFRHM